MNLIVDANVLFSALIKESTTAYLLFKKEFTFYTAEFIFLEFKKYERELLLKTHRSEDDFYKLLEILKRNIRVIPNKKLIPFVETSKEVSPDPKDEVYIALALKLKIPVWSNDKKLKENQDIVKVYNTEDLINLTSNQHKS